MVAWGIAAAVVAVLVAAPSAWATYACSTYFPDAWLCDDFDTYCQGGGYPGTPDCVSGAAKNDWLLHGVWLNSSRNEYNNNLCGTTVNIQEDTDGGGYLIGSYPYAFRYPWSTSEPFGVRYPCQGGAVLGQQTFRDWELSPLPLSEPGQILNFSRLVKNRFGSQFEAVHGTDANPLVMEFFLGGGTTGGTYFNSGYIELAFGEERANTDFAFSPDCYTYCDPYIDQGPFPIMCAQGNPSPPLPEACPPASSAPVRASIAVGVLAMLDTDPCHCGSSMAHGGQGYHLVVYDGKVWWTLKSNAPAASDGEVWGYKPEPRTPMPPHEGAGLAEPGDFTLVGGENYPSPRAWHWVKLIVKAQTFDVELITLQMANPPYPDGYDGNDCQYYVSSVMTGIPRQYKFTTGTGTTGTGAFDTVRMGVGAGCPLASNTDWETCAPLDPANPTVIGRRCLDSDQLQAGSVFFNDFRLSGGEGFSLIGACCLPDGTCVSATMNECAAQGGAYRGPSTTCGDGSICLGACCRSEVLGCADTKRNECPAPFIYMGEGTSCSSVICPCSDPFADADLDGDVDQTDFAVLQACFLGSGVAVSGTCACFDRTDSVGTGPPDGFVDQNDVARFEMCASGPGIPLDPDCDN